jgi:hypothetical protein
MAEVQQMRANEAPCWQCGAVVFKGTKNCPKCGAPSPAVSIATQRKVSLILLRVGLPVGIVSLIAGVIIFMRVLSFDSIEGMMRLVGGGLEVACLLMFIGICGIIAGPVLYFSVKKREQQLSAT